MTVLALAASGWPASASAASDRDGRRTGDHGSIRMYSGNGKHNRSYSAILSPTITRGMQQVSNSSITSSTNMQASLCKKRHRVCKISHKLWMSARW